jgi:molecular chaperone HscB
MEWREAVAEARAAGEHHELEHLHHRLQRDIAQRYDEVAALLRRAVTISSRRRIACGD